MKKPVIGVLALQGCVTPHRFHIESFGGVFKEIRSEEDLIQIDGLILPGGESTTMLKLITHFCLEKSLRKICSEIPVWGICAGAILMATDVRSPAQRSFGLLEMVINRNGYGSQAESFNSVIRGQSVSFIRAPVIRSVESEIKVLAEWNGKPVWVMKNNFMATTFHPELNNNEPSMIHEYFLKMASGKGLRPQN